MVWSSYFWLGALMSSVTGSPGPPESMTPEEPEFRRAERSGPPQIILDLEAAVVMVGGGGGRGRGRSEGFPFYNMDPIWGGGARGSLCAHLRRQEEFFHQFATLETAAAAAACLHHTLPQHHPLVTSALHSDNSDTFAEEKKTLLSAALNCLT